MDSQLGHNALCRLELDLFVPQFPTGKVWSLFLVLFLSCSLKAKTLEGIDRLLLNASVLPVGVELWLELRLLGTAVIIRII